MERQTGKLSFRTKAFFGSGEIISVMAVTVIGLYFMFFLTDVVGIPPIAAGAIFMIGRAWDALIDPLIGALSDRTRTRWGRRRPFFLISAIPIGLFFFLIWFPYQADHPVLLFFCYTGAYILFMTAVTLFHVPYLSLMTELTDDYHERTSVNNYRIFFQLFFGLVAAVVPKMMADSFHDQGDGYMFMGLTVALFILSLPFLLFITTKESPTMLKEYQQSRFFSEFLSVFSNRYFRYLLLIYVGCYAAANVVEGFVIYYMKNWLNREGDMEILFVMVIGTGILSLPFWGRLSRKIGKRRTLIYGLGLWAVSQTSFFLVAPNSPAYLVYVVGAFTGLGYGVAHVIPWSMLPDVLDVDELETGKKREGLFAGVMTLFMKITNSIAIFLIGVILQIGGYTATGDLSDGTMQTIRATMSFAPTLFIVIGLIATLIYPLTRERHQKVREELENQVIL